MPDFDPYAVAGLTMADLWERVRPLLDPEDDAALGEVHVGISDADTKPWADTNHGEDRVNLTLELKPEQLELNLTGWKEAQSDALKDWLQSVPGEKSVSSLDGYEVVAFARRAYKKTETSRPWWQDETIIEVGSCAATACNAGWVARQMFGLGNRKEEKPAFHVRHAWPRADAESLGSDGLAASVAEEVRRLMPLLREIWSAA